MTRAQQAGLRPADVPRLSLTKLRRRHKLDAQVRKALNGGSSRGEAGGEGNEGLVSARVFALRPAWGGEIITAR
jgi:hypothetical protein